MRKFWLGFVSATALLLLSGFLHVRFGLVNPRANIPVSTLESRIAMPALDAAVDRRTPKLHNPVTATDANLTAGMQMYQKHCSNCQGDPARQQASLAEALYPRAPQFMVDAPDMEENQNFCILLHGIRYSAMPAWKQTYGEQQIWQITALLSHMASCRRQCSPSGKPRPVLPRAGLSHL